MWLGKDFAFTTLSSRTCEVAVSVECRLLQLVMRYRTAKKLLVIGSHLPYRLRHEPVLDKHTALCRVRSDALERFLELTPVDDVVECSSTDLGVQDVSDELTQMDRSSQHHASYDFLQHKLKTAVRVKLKLFQSYRLCFYMYDTAL